ncbi:hypothetical protein QA596_12115 [Balneolales bacterium ANBcel1]|nr:hypothetical protein [Balneolales bacterium ANBcel1]
MGRALLILCLGSMIILGMVQRAVYQRQLSATEGNVQTFEVNQARNATGIGLELGLNRLFHDQDQQLSGSPPWVFTVDGMNINVHVDTHDDAPGEVPPRFLRVRAGHTLHGREFESFAFVNEGTIIPPVDGALGFYGTGSEVNLSGNAKISGYDTNPDGSEGPEAAVPGIAAVDEESYLINHQGNASYTGDPDFIHKEDMNAQTVFEFLEMYKTQATVYQSQTDLGSVEYPAITLFDGYNKVSDNVNAAGIMIVTEGSKVDFRGNFAFQGLVLVEGELDIRGNVHVYGAMMFSDNALLEIDDPESSDAYFTGNATIQYSSQALNNINNSLSGIFDETRMVVDRIYY